MNLAPRAGLVPRTSNLQDKLFTKISNGIQYIEAIMREFIKVYFYNTKRMSQSLARQTPDEVYFKDNGLKKAA
jgi:hypothetical protein